MTTKKKAQDDEAKEEGLVAGAVAGEDAPDQGTTIGGAELAGVQLGRTEVAKMVAGQVPVPKRPHRLAGQ